MLSRFLPLIAASALVAACGGNGGSTAIAPVAIPSSTNASPGGSVGAVQQDSAAKAVARTTATALESCYVDAQTYVSCDIAKALGTGAPSLGSAPGQVQLKLSDQSYTVTARSRSGEAFMLIKSSSGILQRSCAGPDRAGDCHGGIW